MILAALVAALIIATGVCNGAQHEECAIAIALLVVAEHNVIDAIQCAESARRRMEAKGEELAYCLRFPDIHNVSPDNCDTLRWAFESLRLDHERACSALESKLKRLNAIIRVVQSNCEEERLHP